MSKCILITDQVFGSVSECVNARDVRKSASLRIFLVLFTGVPFRSFLLCLLQSSIFPLALLHSTTLPPPLGLPYYSDPTLLPLLNLLDSIGQHLSRNLPILCAGAGGLYFEDESGGDVLQLHGGGSFILQGTGQPFTVDSVEWTERSQLE
jgi:hypothetical protein